MIVITLKVEIRDEKFGAGIMTLARAVTDVQTWLDRAVADRRCQGDYPPGAITITKARQT